MELGYLTTEYPAVSHTFIRREILELEERGCRIHRFSIRDCENIVDPVDKLEREKTFYCLSQGIYQLLKNTLYVALTRPVRLFRAFSTTLSLNKKSERSLLRHLAYLAEAATLLQETTSRNLDHIHVHFGTNATSVALLMKILGGPTYSFTVHGPDEFDAPIGFSLASKITDSEFVVAISDFGSAQLKRWASFEDWNKIKVVRCSVSTDFLEPVQTIEPFSRTILCVGRLSAQKGHLLLLEAIKILIDRQVDLKLVLAGDGELRSVLEQRISELSLKDYVDITGWISGEAVKELLLTARGLVLPSFAEGLPVVIMEAFALKRPVVSTYVSGIPELVKHGENGFLSIAGDVDSLTESIQRLMTTPVEQLNSMGSLGHTLVKERHFIKTQVSLLEQEFRELIS